MGHGQWRGRTPSCRFRLVALMRTGAICTPCLITFGGGLNCACHSMHNMHACETLGGLSRYTRETLETHSRTHDSACRKTSWSTFGRQLNLTSLVDDQLEYVRKSVDSSTAPVVASRSTFGRWLVHDGACRTTLIPISVPCR